MSSFGSTTMLAVSVVVLSHSLDHWSRFRLSPSRTLGRVLHAECRFPVCRFPRKTIFIVVYAILCTCFVFIYRSLCYTTSTCTVDLMYIQFSRPCTFTSTHFLCRDLTIYRNKNSIQVTVALLDQFGKNACKSVLTFVHAPISRWLSCRLDTRRAGRTRRCRSDTGAPLLRGPRTRSPWRLCDSCRLSCSYEVPAWKISSVLQIASSRTYTMIQCDRHSTGYPSVTLMLSLTVSEVKASSVILTILSLSSRRFEYNCATMNNSVIVNSSLCLELGSMGMSKWWWLVKFCAVCYRELGFRIDDDWCVRWLFLAVTDVDVRAVEYCWRWISMEDVDRARVTVSLWTKPSLSVKLIWYYEVNVVNRKVSCWNETSSRPS